MQQVCDGSIYQDNLLCPEGCFNGQCAECTPNTKVCAGALAYRVCSLDGKLSNPMNCPSGYTCDNDGDCVATPQCTTGQRNCVSDVVYSCVNSTWQLLYQCPPETTCKETQGTAFCAAVQSQSGSQSGQPTPTPTPTPEKSVQTIGLVELIGLIVALSAAAGLWYLFTKMKK
jgi:hypothetical protein